MDLFTQVTTYTVETDGPLVLLRIWVNGKKTTASIIFDEKYKDGWVNLPASVIQAAKEERDRIDQLPF